MFRPSQVIRLTAEICAVSDARNLALYCGGLSPNLVEEIFKLRVWILIFVFQHLVLSCLEIAALLHLLVAFDAFAVVAVTCISGISGMVAAILTGYSLFRPTRRTILVASSTNILVLICSAVLLLSATSLLCIEAHYGSGLIKFLLSARPPVDKGLSSLRHLWGWIVSLVLLAACHFAVSIFTMAFGNTLIVLMCSRDGQVLPLLDGSGLSDSQQFYQTRRQSEGTPCNFYGLDTPVKTEMPSKWLPSESKDPDATKKALQRSDSYLGTIEVDLNEGGNSHQYIEHFVSETSDASMSPFRPASFIDLDSPAFKNDPVTPLHFNVNAQYEPR